MTDSAQAVCRAQRHAPFLAGLLDRHADLARLLADGAWDAALREWTKVPAEDSFAARLRQQRGRLALVLACADLAGRLSLTEVTRRLSDFADDALDRALAQALRERHPDADAPGITAIALGKHGGQELNYSSDIDPILLFDPATIPHRPREEPGESAVRLARRACELLQARDEHGYVFRVDLRLRPASEVTPIALPVEAAITHYESSALPWERAAFIRARAAAGDRALGERFLGIIQPFVWRRSLDYGAIDELRAMSMQIRDHHASGQRFGPGYDLKRGRGGIREVEFFAQIHQLIHGGREVALRIRDTRQALAALAAADRIAPSEAAALAEAYTLFRTIEHRLQMVEDRQTHALPADTAALDNVAQLHGLDDGSALLALLAPHVDRVGNIYDALDGGRGGAGGAGAASHYPRLPALDQRLAEWRGGSVRALRSPAALAAFEELLPGLLKAFSDGPDPAAALGAFDRLVSALPSGLNLFRLLVARPRLTALLTDILIHAPVLADALAQAPALLDRLIDATAFDPLPDVATLADELAAPGEALEARLDRVRYLVGEHRFALGTQLIEGAADPLDVGAGYARLAEAAVGSVADAVTDSFRAAHGVVPGAELCVLALGRLGGGRLTHASDLDLIYLIGGEATGESDGPRPLAASLYFNRLAQRLTGGLSVPTSAGALYEVDTRLRPSGNQGPLVVSFDAFARYQRESAWTWEHMALCRARPVHGSPQAREALQGVIRSVLARPRDVAALRRDVVDMRAEMARHKPASGPLDLKLLPGGLVDLEFVTHFHQLAHGEGLVPSVRDALVALAASCRVSDDLVGAHDLLSRGLIALRLMSPSMTVPAPASADIVARACHHDDWPALERAFAAARAAVQAAWTEMAGGERR